MKTSRLSGCEKHQVNGYYLMGLKQYLRSEFLGAEKAGTRAKEKRG